MLLLEFEYTYNLLSPFLPSFLFLSCFLSLSLSLSLSVSLYLSVSVFLSFFLSFLPPLSFGVDTRSFSIRDVSCTGSEGVLLQCSYSVLSSSACTDNNDVSVTCCK